MEAHLDEMYNKLLRIAATTLRRKSYSSDNKTNWWTPQLQQQRSKVKALQRRLRETNGSVVRQVLSREEAHKRSILKRKREYWSHLCNNAKKEFGVQFKLAHGKVLLPQHLVSTVLN